MTKNKDIIFNANNIKLVDNDCFCPYVINV